MSYPGTPSGAGGSGSGFPVGVYPQPIGTLSGSRTGAGVNTSSITSATAGMSIQGSSGSPFAGSSSSPFAHQQSTIPITTTPVGTAPRKQLAAAAAAGAAMGAAKSGRPKGPYKKAGGGGGGGGGSSKRGGRGGGRGGRAGSTLGADDDDDKGGKDSDDDNEDEPEVSIEEQFILRLPPGEMCDRFREKVIAREVDESAKLIFTDARRGTFTFEGIEFPTKLVDLPTIIEAQKTLNGKQMYKIADISQMLVVDETPAEKIIKTEPETGARDEASQAMPAPTLPPLKPSEYIWPDGLTNPLKNVRKRRFRKRVSKVAVEGVENEIERLLQEDKLAEEVIYEMREQVDGMDRFDSDDGATPAPEGGQSDMDMDDGDGEMMDMDEEEDDEEEDEEDDQYEQDLLAELEREIGGGENATDDEGGTPQPQERTPVSQPSGLSGSHANYAVQPQTNTHKSGGSGGAGNTGSSAGLPGLGEIRSASGSHPSTTGFSSTPIGASSSAAKPTDKGKSKAQREDDDDDDDDEEEEEDEEEEDDDDDDDDSGSDDDDDEDDEDDKEKAQVEKMLKDEIKELDSKIQENEEKLQSAPNEILKLRKELELKKSQLEEARGKSKGK
ncbi:hypothetical protein BGZ95_004818 [Linnemannia exigua]|uniref:TAFII55 protein conserved region domain-containing protein n=1 Tax=Linnemannia exigua TaxID=604196 RepID=A0AAD4DH53_9FUNG|nr:hypothetical protein BGZ95_004818 [Linnemannia exigua]